MTVSTNHDVIGLKLVWKVPKYYCPFWRRCIFLVCRNQSNYNLSVIMIYISSLLQLLMIYIFPGCRFSQVSASILLISCNGFLRSEIQPWRILEEEHIDKKINSPYNRQSKWNPHNVQKEQVTVYFWPSYYESNLDI